jgi:hypothetical protein
MLKRYQIPDCLTIITQRLTKYLTLIENMTNNSKEDKYDNDLLTRSLETLKLILTRVNDAVALNQNANEYKRLIDTIDAKSFTYYQIKTDKKLEQIKFTKNDLLSAPNKPDRKLLSINHVIVKCMSKNAKIYKDVTCLTMSDLIVFLQLNDKSKYVFMNDNSVIPFTSGILIRPKISELTHSRSSSFSNSSNFTNNLVNNSSSNNTNSSINNSILSTSNNSFNNSTSSNSSSTLPSYIVNTITNEIIELKFPDEISRNQWLTLVHTNILPLIEENTNNTTASHNNLDSFIKTKNNTTLQHQNSVSSNTSTLSSSSSTISNNNSNSNQKMNKNFRNLKIATDCVAPELQTAIQIEQQGEITCNHHPLLIANTYRCNSNISNRSTISSGQGSFISTFSSSSSSSSSSHNNKQLNQNNNETLNLSDLALNNQQNSSVSSPIKTNLDCNFINNNNNSNTNNLDNNEMVLSNDLANIIYSFNNLIQDNLFHGNLMRSASSAGETVTRNNQIIHVSIPKRAETFNGASSSKETQNLSSDINGKLINKLKPLFYSSYWSKVWKHLPAYYTPFPIIGLVDRENLNIKKQ